MDIDFIVNKDKQEFKESFTNCPVCGKRFYLSNFGRKDYTYKTKNKEGLLRYACSHTCYNSLKEIVGKSKSYRKGF